MRLIKLVTVVLVSGVLVGCGNDLSGTYEGTETRISNGVVNNGFNNNQFGSGSSRFVLTLQDNDGVLTGNWESDVGTGTVSGSADGDQITSITFRQISGNNFNSGFGNNSCGGDMTGTLSHNDGQITGSLTSLNTGQPISSGSFFPSNGNGCFSAASSASYNLQKRDD